MEDIYHKQFIVMKRSKSMNLFTNWKTTIATLVFFVFSMVFLPGLAAKAMAADTIAPSDAAAGAAGTAASEGAAGAAGAAGGEAVFAGLSAGTIATGAVVVAAGIAIIAASSSRSSSTSHH
jgi:hypothetical protein